MGHRVYCRGSLRVSLSGSARILEFGFVGFGALIIGLAFLGCYKGQYTGSISNPKPKTFYKGFLIFGLPERDKGSFKGVFQGVRMRIQYICFNMNRPNLRVLGGF